MKVPPRKKDRPPTLVIQLLSLGSSTRKGCNKANKKLMISMFSPYFLYFSPYFESLDEFKWRKSNVGFHIQYLVIYHVLFLMCEFPLTRCYTIFWSLISQLIQIKLKSSIISIRHTCSISATNPDFTRYICARLLKCFMDSKSTCQTRTFFTFKKKKKMT